MYGWHDPSAVIFKDGKLIFGVEEERYSREKHAHNTFPESSIRACLDHAGVAFSDLDEVLLPYRPELRRKILPYDVKSALATGSIPERIYQLNETVTSHLMRQFFPIEQVQRRLNRQFAGPIPEIRTVGHHRCHAASAFHPTGFEEALVLTLDAQGEYDATVVWHGTENGLERIETFKQPNSLGYLFGGITEFLGYRANNGEGKVMGLAPYGDRNKNIRETFESVLDIGADYDVTGLVDGTIEGTTQNIEQLFQLERSDRDGKFTDWEKDFARVSQGIVEEVVAALVDRYRTDLGVTNVGLAGGVAMNCKMNKRVMELDAVEELFVQPVAHDAGLAVGAGFLGQSPSAVPEMDSVYWGPEYESTDIESLLKKNKIDYEQVEDLERVVAETIADGELVGWFQGRLEMGPRALGNRSILADPRSEASRDRVNRYVKHREEWRPFAPSILEGAVEEYLVNGSPAQYMIKTFDVVEEVLDDMAAVVHPADNTTRPQTVNEEQNPRYHRLINEFESITGVPVVLNTSFNDHGEPVVNTPKEALKDFYGMGLDVLVLGDYIVRK